MEYKTTFTATLVMLALLGCDDAHKRTSSHTTSAQTGPREIYIVQHAAPRPPVMLGVGMEAAGPILAKHASVHETNCTLITNVAPDTPAQRAGLEDWDLVVMVDGSEDASPAAIRRTLRASKPGDRITLTISRGGKQMEITATLEEADHARMTLLPAGEPGT